MTDSQIKGLLSKHTVEVSGADSMLSWQLWTLLILGIILMWLKASRNPWFKKE